MRCGDEITEVQFHSSDTFVTNKPTKSQVKVELLASLTEI